MRSRAVGTWGKLGMRRKRAQQVWTGAARHLPGDGAAIESQRVGGAEGTQAHPCCLSHFLLGNKSEYEQVLGRGIKLPSQRA